MRVAGFIGREPSTPGVMHVAGCHAASAAPLHITDVVQCLCLMVSAAVIGTLPDGAMVPAHVQYRSDC